LKGDFIAVAMKNPQKNIKVALMKEIKLFFSIRIKKNTFLYASTHTAKTS